MGDAASSNFRHKDSSVLPADNGDAQGLCTFVHNDVAWFLQVWSGGKEKYALMSSFTGKQLQNATQEIEKVKGDVTITAELIKESPTIQEFARIAACLL